MKVLFKCLITIILFAVGYSPIHCQVGIGTNSPSPSSILHLESTDKGLLIPSLTTVQKMNINMPSDGLMVHDSGVGAIYVYDAGESIWKKMMAENQIIDSDSDTEVSVEKTIDNDLIQFYIQGKNFITFDSSRIIIDSNSDIYIGDFAGHQSETKLNTIIGNASFEDNTIGNQNTSIGFAALQDNTIGSQNFSGGSFALQYNRTGSRNISIGTFSMRNSDDGNSNIALGYSSQHQNANGDYNIAIGDSSLYNNSSANSNIAIGRKALFANTTTQNIAIGESALSASTSNARQIAIGV